MFGLYIGSVILNLLLTLLVSIRYKFYRSRIKLETKNKEMPLDILIRYLAIIIIPVLNIVMIGVFTYFMLMDVDEFIAMYNKK